RQREATPSTIPTLLLAGSFDAVTPTSWARIAARTLPNSTLLQFPGIGHFVTLASPCAQRVFASFLATPSAPRTACVAKIRPPRFKPAPRGCRPPRLPSTRGVSLDKTSRDTNRELQEIMM